MTTLEGVSPTRTQQTGPRGCCATTERRGTLRYCAQRAIHTHQGKTYCYYHWPVAPRKFGEPWHEGHGRGST